MWISRHQDRGKPQLQAVPFRGTARSEEMIASSGVTFLLWRLYQHAWVICLAFPLVALVREPVSLGHLALGSFSLVGFATGYTWLMWPHPVSQEARPRSPPRFSFWLFPPVGVLA